MLSEYVLLCAPYRFEQDFLNKLDERIIQKELYSVVMPGINIFTRRFVRAGIKNNYGIVDQETLESEIQALQRGDYQAIEDIQSAINDIEDGYLMTLFNELNIMTKGKGLQGFDDCRIIDTLTKAYAGKLINKADFTKLFEEHTNRIVSDYSSWEQYLASCVLGKLVQVAQNSWTVTTKEEFIEDIYYYCIAPVNVFSYSKFWQDYNLENLGQLLSKILSIDYAQDDEE